MRFDKTVYASDISPVADMKRLLADIRWHLKTDYWTRKDNPWAVPYTIDVVVRPAKKPVKPGRK